MKTIFGVIADTHGLLRSEALVALRGVDARRPLTAGSPKPAVMVPPGSLAIAVNGGFSSASRSGIVAGGSAAARRRAAAADDVDSK